MKSRLWRFWIAGLLALALGQSLLAGDCLVKKGDRVVFYGDSITEQRLYTTYIEACLMTRFPDWGLWFRNAGWSGDTAEGAVNRLERDVLSLKPTLVTTDFGMNDGRYAAFAQDRFDWYVKNQRELVRRLKAVGVRVVPIAASPVDESRRQDKFSYNETLAKFGGGLKQVAIDEQVPFIDQFSPFVQVLKAVQAKQPDLVLVPDSVHPSPAGHVVMAWAILKGLEVPGLVSTAELTAEGKVTASEGCKIAQPSVDKGTLTFVREDQCLPMPVDPRAMGVMLSIPIAQELSKFELKVTGLEDAKQYQLTIDNEAAVRANGADWAKGVNLTLAQGPIQKQCSNLLTLVFRKNDTYFDRWRNVQLWRRPDWLPDQITQTYQTNKLREMDGAVAVVEKALEEATRPKPHTWALAPAQ